MPALVYCPRCGSPMQRRFTEGRDREVCPACGFVFYRNPVPAVGVVVALEEQLVLIQRKYEPQAGHWALPAGYMELGESAEEAAIRECHEETGLLVQIDHLLGVYSFGEGDHSGLVIIYAATAVGGELHACDDAIQAGVFPLDALPAPMAFHTHLQAIERWRREGHLASARLNVLSDQDQAIVVRRAGPADAPAALDLLLGQPYTGDTQQVVIEALLHDRLHDPDRPVLVAELAGVVAGVAILSLHQTLRGWEATLDELTVAPDARRRSLGSALIQAALRLARARGCTLIRTGMARESQAAHAFLSANGFIAGEALTLEL